MPIVVYYHQPQQTQRKLINAQITADDSQRELNRLRFGLDATSNEVILFLTALQYIEQAIEQIFSSVPEENKKERALLALGSAVKNFLCKNIRMYRYHLPIYEEVYPERKKAIPSVLLNTYDVGAIELPTVPLYLTSLYRDWNLYLISNDADLDHLLVSVKTPAILIQKNGSAYLAENDPFTDAKQFMKARHRSEKFSARIDENLQNELHKLNPDPKSGKVAVNEQTYGIVKRIIADVTAKAQRNHYQSTSISRLSQDVERLHNARKQFRREKRSPQDFFLHRALILNRAPLSKVIYCYEANCSLQYLPPDKISYYFNVVTKSLSYIIEKISINLPFTFIAMASGQLGREIVRLENLFKAFLRKNNIPQKISIVLIDEIYKTTICAGDDHAFYEEEKQPYSDSADSIATKIKKLQCDEAITQLAIFCNSKNVNCEIEIHVFGSANEAATFLEQQELGVSFLSCEDVWVKDGAPSYLSPCANDAMDDFLRLRQIVSQRSNASSWLSVAKNDRLKPSTITIRSADSECHTDAQTFTPLPTFRI